MDEDVLARCQKLENESQSVSVEKAGQAVALERELSFATDPAERFQLEQQLHRARKEWFEANTNLLKARIETAKAALASLALSIDVKQTAAFNKLIAPSFNNDISRAEDDLRQHLENENRYYRK